MTIDQIDVYTARAPFRLRGEAPAYHPSTDAHIGTHVWTLDDEWASADAAARAAGRYEDHDDAAYTVVDAEGRDVFWPELGCELPADWWEGGKERAAGCPEDYIGF